MATAAANNVLEFPGAVEAEVVDSPSSSAEPVPGSELAVSKPAEAEGNSGAQVLVGAGVAAGLGLLGYGLFRFGERSGWWGDGSNLIIDDTEGGGSKADDSKSGGGGSKTDGGGSKSGNRRAVGNPPNVSGDPEGYNTTMFPSPMAVRIAMRSLGYTVEIEAAALVGEDETHGEVKRFQADWNRIIRGIDSGKVKLSKGVHDPSMLNHYRGILTADDVPGKYSLRAMEIAINNSLANRVRFHELRKAAGA